MLLKQWFYRPSPVVDQCTSWHFLKRRLPLLCLVSGLLLFSEALFATQVAGLYDVDIAVADESVAVREQAFQRGLAEVFVRVSGDSIVMTRQKSPPPGRYIKQFSYEPLQTAVTDEQGEPLMLMLKVQYNGSLVEKHLLDNGLPVWGQHRPELVIWLAVRDGANEYVLRDNDQSQIKTAAAAALTRRGIPALWPLYDDKDKKILSIADIRGGFREPVSKASLRYSRGPALTGSLLWNGNEWQSSWSLMLASENQHWSLVDKDYDRLLTKSIDQAADALGAIFAIQDAANKANFTSIQLAIAGVDSIDEYRSVENYLTAMSAVTLLRPLQVDGEQVIFEITLRSTQENFLNLLHNDAELTRVELKKAPLQPARSMPMPMPQPVPQAAPLMTDNPGAAAPVSPTLTSALSRPADAEQLVETQNQPPIYYYRLNN